MNKKIYTILEFDKIKNLLSNKAVTQRGKELAEQLEAQSDSKKVEKLLNQTESLIKIDRLRGGLPIDRIDDLSNVFKRLKLKATLSSTELSFLKPNFNSVNKIISFYESIRLEKWFYELNDVTELVDKLTDFTSIANKIDMTVDDNGNILNSASVNLNNIRRKINALQDAIKETLNKIVRGSQSKFLSDTNITVRDGVFVLQVKSENRTKFGGVVHDQSQSGQTLYIEPKSVLSMNDDIHELQIQETREINKILFEISNELANELQTIINNNEIIALLDLIQAKAKLAKSMDANKPSLSKNKVISLKKARHPLIEKKIAIANTIEIGDGFSSLVITGPNTGGKTILMKTLGILQLMAQSGMYITASEDSVVYNFSEILADIGDEQSLEQNLSTFSSHIVNIKNILKIVNQDSLVLLDELGAGTDPKEGAALAMAITQRINEIGALSLITTHYPELKLFADNQPFAKNASMEFNNETLQPTYKLLVGIPGQSNALFIAKKIGLDSQLIDQANSYIDPKSQKINNLIVDLVKQQQEVEQKNNELSFKINDVHQKENDLINQLNKIEIIKNKEILDAKNTANNIISSSKKTAEKIVAEIRSERLKLGKKDEAKNEQQLQLVLKKFDQQKQNTSLEKNKILKKAKAAKEFKIGEDVLVTEYNQTGVLIKKLDNRKWEVRLGILKMSVDEDEIEKIKISKKEKKITSKKVRVIKTASANISGSLDLRGIRYEEAMQKLDRYIDQAVLNNLGTVEIIHGKGTGALRLGVTQLLQSDNRVKNFQFANPNGAGDGATIVELS
ncbi:MAG: endonuclease MutS2 [Lactobacillaceae bacterium]|jgi:DNA mismatch repair protein MutS2|nr:endonuclease MutS2 [Lactobacillaceae bacterium]